MVATEYVKLAQTLPPRLLRFLARYPPPSSIPNKPITPEAVATSLNTSSLDPNARQIETYTSALPYANPFTKMKHHITGQWHDPKIPLRRQAEMCKMARSYGIEDLLPPTSKSSQARLQRRVEKGVRVKGTGVGQRVKGKIFERTMRKRLETRRQAMLKMPQLVQQWRQVSGFSTLVCSDYNADFREQLGHGRGWKKWPK